MAAEDPRPVLNSPFVVGEFCEIIRHRCGMSGVRVGEASNPGPRQKRRRRAVSSDSQSARGDRETLLDALEQDLQGDAEPTARDDSFRTTQWESGASFSLCFRGPEFISESPVSVQTLSNRFDDLDDGRRPEVHVLSDEEAGVSTVSDTSSVLGEPRIRRRLSLVWDENHRPQSSMDVEEDPESIHLDEEGSDGFASERGMSEPDEEEQELDDPPPTGAPLELDVRARNVSIGMACLDEFHLPEIFKHRARVMRTVPLFLKGAFRGALRVAFEEAQCARDTNDDARNSRAWKLFMLLPRMLLSRPPRGGQVPKKQLEERFSMFSAGQWAELIRASLALSATGSQAAIRRRRRRNHDDVHKRADRALQLVQMGELSAGRLALDGAQVVGGDNATLKALTDQRRRPAVPRTPLSQSILEAQPEVFSLDEGLFVQSLR